MKLSNKIALSASIYFFTKIVHAATCPFLALSVVEMAMPEYSPWTVHQAADDQCEFRGKNTIRGISHSRFQIMKIVQTSADDATALEKILREARMKTSHIYPEPALGREANFFIDKEISGGNMSWQIVRGTANINGHFADHGSVEFDAAVRKQLTKILLEVK